MAAELGPVGRCRLLRAVSKHLGTLNSQHSVIYISLSRSPFGLSGHVGCKGCCQACYISIIGDVNPGKKTRLSRAMDGA